MSYPQPPPYRYGPRYDGCLKFALYVLSFLIPPVGIVVGIIYLSRGDPEAVALGRACLILAIVAIVVWCCVAAGLGALPMLLQTMAGG